MNREEPGRARIIFLAGGRYAGKSLILREFELAGYTCVDNLPLSLVEGYVAGLETRRGNSRHALVLELEHTQVEGLNPSLRRLRAALESKGIRASFGFVAAGDSALEERWASSGGEGREARAEAERREKERGLLEPFRQFADVVVDSSYASPLELRDRLAAFIEDQPHRLKPLVEISSFGFKFGAPSGDIVIDVRFIKNPYYDKELRPLSGKDKPCADFVLSQAGAAETLEGLHAILKAMVPAYEAQGRSRIRVRIGCTGGWHRSVAIAEALGSRLSKDGVEVVIRHRELPEAQG